MDETTENRPPSSDSGAHAEGEDATAVGERGVNIGGSVGGDVVTGEKVAGDMVLGDKVSGDKVMGDKHVHIVEAEEKAPPLQLPPRAEHFTGRAAELTRLAANLRPGRVEAIVGPGGMGKSALAAEAVWRLHESGQLLTRFPDGLVFHTFYNQSQADAALDNIARSFTGDPKGSATDTARRALSGKSALLVLDGAEDADNLPAVLDVRGASGVLITTRSVDDAPGGWIQLDILTNDESVALLLKWTKRPEDDDAPYRAICDLVGHLPLAVRLAGRYMRHHRQSPESYLAWLKQTPLDALDQGHRQQDSVPLLMTRSLEQVSETARQTMALAGLMALAPFEPATLAKALETTENDLRHPLGELLNLGLLLPDGYDRVQVAHALVRTYARERLHPAEGALERLAAYYQALVEEQNALGAAGHARLDLDLPHLMALLRRLSERGDWPPLLALALPVAVGYLAPSGRWAEHIEACNLALATSRATEEQLQEANWLNNLAHAYRNLGRYDEAIDSYEKSVTIAQKLGDRQLEGTALGNMGLAYRNLGRYDEAINYIEQAMHIFEEIKSPAADQARRLLEEMRSQS